EKEKLQLQAEQKRREEEIKNKELEDLQKRELEKQLRDKDEMIKQLDSRIRAIEEDKKLMAQRKHQKRVQGVIDNMLASGLIKQEEVDAKRKSLEQLGSDALNEISVLVKG